MRDRIYQYILEKGQVTPHSLGQVFSIGMTMIHRHLKKLVAENKIKKVGTAPKVFYTLVRNQGLSSGGNILRNKIEAIQKIQEDIETVMQKYQVKTAQLYGSFARGEQNKNSDVDLLVDFIKPIDGWTLTGMVYDLEDAVGRKVDLVTKNSMSPFLFPFIKKDLTQVYAKK